MKDTAETERDFPSAPPLVLAHYIPQQSSKGSRLNKIRHQAAITNLGKLHDQFCEVDAISVHFVTLLALSFLALSSIPPSIT
ncbi:hypothetical protein JK208_05150 [Gluconobacter sp. Dm-74]|uniref:hypothetical protein n=1 Tax=Gluconobacter sp. Dm-74 TaxID=2799803 RepID=UPI001B8BB98D|nr:hypothetical protein [Gluconobacter sp. Dm-74]MBS1090993.1 hypothetical protein [Gluconobacter sp. Dm-74]